MESRRGTVRQRKLLMVAGTGGHLTELVRLSPRFDISEDSVWVTFDTEQSRSMLKGKNTFFVPYVSPRDWKGTLRAFKLIADYLKNNSFDGAYSTGAAIALAAFFQPRLRQVPRVYIESVSRTQGPSLTGRILAFFPFVQVFTQHQIWANNRWKHTESLLAQYRTLDKDIGEDDSPQLFVTLGTIKPYRFDALVDTILESGFADANTVWQLGITDRDDLPGVVHQHMAADEFVSAAKAASVVVTHAGVGTVLQLLELGKSPVVVPREKARQEHVDDHQFEISELLTERNLAVVTRAHDLSAVHIERAMNQRTESHD